MSAPTRRRAANSSAQGIYHVGLFGVVGLHKPSDFVRLGKVTAAAIERLVEEVTRGDGARGDVLLAAFDEMSDSFCIVLDTAEVCRSVHPDPVGKDPGFRVWGCR